MCLSGSEAEGGAGVRSLSPPTLYPPGGKLVFRNTDSRKSGGCVPPNARLSRLIRFCWIESCCCLQLRSRQSSVPVCQCTCMVPRPGGRLVFESPTLLLPGCHGGRPMAGRCSEDDQASKIFYFPCYRLHGLVVLRVGLGSVPAGWVRLRPAVGFRFGRFGVEKETLRRN